MHTTRLWTLGVFSTTTMWLPSAPPNPSSEMAAVPSSRRRGFVVGINPGSGDDLGAVHGTEVVLEVLDDGIELLGVQESLRDEHGLDRRHPGFDWGERLRRVVVLARVVRAGRGGLGHPAASR